MQSSVFFKTQRPGRPLKKAGRPSRRTCTNIDTCIIVMHLLLARTNIRFHSRETLWNWEELQVETGQGLQVGYLLGQFPVL